MALANHRLRIQTSSEELVSVVSSWDTAGAVIGAATLLASVLLQLAADMTDASSQTKAGAAAASERSASELLRPLLRLQRLLPDALRGECLSLCLIGANACGKVRATQLAQRDRAFNSRFGVQEPSDLVWAQVLSMLDWFVNGYLGTALHHVCISIYYPSILSLPANPLT